MKLRIAMLWLGVSYGRSYILLHGELYPRQVRCSEYHLYNAEEVLWSSYCFIVLIMSLSLV